jgi:hypothetical protein
LFNRGQLFRQLLNFCVKLFRLSFKLLTFQDCCMMFRSQIAERRGGFGIDAYLLHQLLSSGFDVVSRFRENLLDATGLIITGQQHRAATFEGRSFQSQHGLQMSFLGLRFGDSVFHQVLLADESLQIGMKFSFASRLMANGGFEAGDPTS